MHPLVPIAILVPALVALPLAAAAQDATPPDDLTSAPPPLTEVSATWADEEGHVTLEVTYEGGACEEAGEAEVTAAASLIDHVTIPTMQTAEVCTMQIVPVTYSGIIAVEPHTQTLEITILAPDGQPKAAGSVDIVQGDPAPLPDQVEDRGGDGAKE